MGIVRGSVVEVRLGPRRMLGVVTDVSGATDVPAEKLQTITNVVALPPVPPDVLDMAEFVATYYQEAPGMALALTVPPNVGGGMSRTFADTALALTERGRTDLPARLARAPVLRRLFERMDGAPEGLLSAQVAALPPHARHALRRWHDDGLVAACASAGPSPDVALPLLNAEQRDAANAIVGARGGFAPFVLYGVTGSGKTDVYLDAARRVIAEGSQVLLLVPEINLTPQQEQRVRAALPGVRIATLHSGLAGGQRRAHWLAAATGDAKLVLGTRLAVFAPMPALGLIIVDEEQDASYKQQDGVRYQARDVAVWRAHRRGVPVVLGSATPSLESWLHAQE
ncbi:MAG TPA: DEAD/DEAH box helicase, partial [Casimicrobiaceae bacterium]